MRCVAPWARRPRYLPCVTLIVRPISRYHSSSSIDTLTSSKASTESIVPSTSQLLRFSITASSRVGDNNHSKAIRSQVIKLLDADWNLGPPAALWLPLKGVQPINQRQGTLLLSSVVDVAALKSVIERMVIHSEGAARLQVNNCIVLGNALQRCQSHNTYSEIVAVLSDIIARLERLKLPIYSQLCELGIYYAALDLSIPALHQFLRAWQRKTAKRLTFGDRIVQALTSAVNAKFFETPNYDPSPLLAELTGEGGVPSDMHTILYQSLHQNQHDFAALLRLLAGIGSDEPLYEFWAAFLQTFDRKDPDACRSAYSVVLILIKSGRSETALDFLEDISKQCNGTLPHIKNSHDLQTLFQDPVVGRSLANLVNDECYKTLLEAGFASMEQRLGITWQGTREKPNSKAHFGVTLNSLWATLTDQPLLTIDGDCAGYDDITRFYPELQAHGCSKSRQELGQVVDLLNDHDGDVYNVVVQLNLNEEQWKSFQSEFPSAEFRWCPQRSPIEFSDSPLPTLTDQSEQWTPASLGLMRARPYVNGEPQAGANGLHLMQLGYLEMRRGPNEPWKPSGYIVAWDRQFGETIALFVGEYSAVIGRGAASANAPFGTVMSIRPFDKPHVLPLSPDRQPRVFSGRYYLDVDPSPDLGP
ncbi:uncharacterized protein N7503_008261 [Penicillium pulvis]|uniref:uncharacterized protein n=1 Tax=Penicillium pulvis TaxID=1562058 RepID=UPI0025492D52|nr:uncharacterized protein N7503_008261 [Penicillium pulvis]KAJ5792283.1 hypothetical protein N7503_008261 [Penicillium pulvis]